MPASAAATKSAALTDDLTTGRRVPAWVMSAVVHTVGLIVLVLTVRWSPQGAAPEPDRAVGVALARQRDGKVEYFDQAAEQSHASQNESSAAAASAAAPLPEPSELPMDLGGVLPTGEELASVGDPGDFLPSADTLTQGTQPGKNFGGQAKTQVFGLAGQGSKFVYVFDRSFSMSGYGGRPLKAAKNELIASLTDLDSTHQFQIIFYNESPRPYAEPGSTPRLVFGDDQGRNLATRFVRGIVATGSTKHMPALEMALKLRPDVIFFLTDAGTDKDDPRLSPDQLNTLRRKNRGTQIHAIEFGFGPGSSDDNFLKQLARQNEGGYIYIDISKLPR